MYNSSYAQTAERLRRDIENHLYSLGLLCRVFGRGKTHPSLESKLARNPGKYAATGRLIQDAIGIRVVLYFPEDVGIVQNLLGDRYQWDRASSTVDLPTDATFSVTRYNLIFRLPEDYLRETDRVKAGLPIDGTFEVQLRTVLSEGWHEVEHDLRYKCHDHWDGHDDLSRTLNGVVATLETAEWTMRKLFTELSYRHYKQKNWSAMLHTELRMRVQPKLSKELAELFSSDAECAKGMHRIDRTKIIQSLAKLERAVPVNLDNIVHLWNVMSVRNSAINDLAPSYLVEVFESDLGLRL